MSRLGSSSKKTKHPETVRFWLGDVVEYGDTCYCFSALGSSTDGEASEGRLGDISSGDWESYVKKDILPSYYAGPLLVKRLPVDAWGKWCNDGVVCFRMFIFDVLKIYFANPRNLSIYHVVDFHFPKFGLVPEAMVGCALVGSKIYVLPGSCHANGRLSVYYCDVANQPQLLDGGYEWMAGPMLNSPKPMPCVFYLAGNIYALSMLLVSYFKPFEVLKPGSNKWKVLTPPFPANALNHLVLGTLVIDDDKYKKFLVHSSEEEHDEYLSIYDAVQENWTRLKVLRHRDSMLYSSLPSRLCSIFSMEDIGLLLCGSESFVLDSFYMDFEKNVLKLFLGLDLMDDILGKQKRYNRREIWHLVPLRGGSGRFCLLQFRSDFERKKERTSVRFATFDLVQGKKSDTRRKRHKLPGSRVENMKYKTIELLRGETLWPSGGCTKVGSFSKC